MGCGGSGGSGNNAGGSGGNPDAAASEAGDAAPYEASTDASCDECASGSVKCVNGSISDCAPDANGCLKWGTPTSCPSHACASSTNCSPVQDSGGGPTGVCGEGKCTSGSKRCNGLVPETCDSSGQWQADTACSHLCVAGACTGSCAPGQIQCSGKVPETCDAKGAWLDGNACSSTCTNGTCDGWATSVAIGSLFACALNEKGGVLCWGENGRGELGNQYPDKTLVPLPVQSLTSGVQAITAGDEHACALTTKGGVKCWGSNYSGQMGQGAVGGWADAPTDVPGLGSGIVAVSAGGQFTCALTNAGSVKCWGDNSGTQLGDGTQTLRTSPVNIAGLSGVKAIAAGYAHVCALTTAGRVKCWGDNSRLQLGLPKKSIFSPSPVDVCGLDGPIKALAAGDVHTCALTSKGAVECWGGDDHGQLGDLIDTDRATPAIALGLTSGVEFLAAGGATNLALSGGKLLCFGYCTSGSGKGAHALASPVHSAAVGRDFSALDPNSFETYCAIMTGGELECWGDDEYGLLGDGNTNYSDTPVAVDQFGGCVPDCNNKYCGSDGCGGSCGTCSSGTCSQGQCVCTPSCGTRVCGGNGCGGSCGTCGTGQLCFNGTCDCDPVNDTGCNLPNECWLLSNEQSTCAVPGSGTQGSGCTTTSDCAGGYACFSSTCHKICNFLTGNGCPTNLGCAKVSGWTTYGACG